MQGEENRSTEVDEYISRYPDEVQRVLIRIREVIRQAAPEAVERIGYGMPGYYLNGGLVWFAGHRHHIGFYPTPSGIEAFKEELSAYKGAKGSVQFPLDKPMPYELIREIVKFRVAESQGEAARRKQDRRAQPAGER